MMLEDLKKSVSEMTAEELLALILEIRSSRRSRQAAAVTVHKEKADPINKLVNKMTPEQKATLAKMLGGTK